MTYRYLAFGLRISSDFLIPGLPEAPDDARTHLQITLETDGDTLAAECDVLWHEVATDDRDGTLRVWRRIADSGYRFAYSDGSEFLIDALGTRVIARWTESIGVDGGTVYLIGPVLGFVLRLRGVTCLHASAVVVDGRCIVVVAPGGHGKSSIAAAFALRGVAVLTEDLLALRETDRGFKAQPAYPRVRLWPHAAAQLFGSIDALPRITPDDLHWDKRYLDLAGEGFRFHARPATVAAIYSGVHDEEAINPFVRPMRGRDALLALLPNAYSHGFPGRDTRARDVEVLARLAESVPVRSFHMREGFDQLDSLCALLVQDCMQHEATMTSAGD